ncbi:MAG TPA: hypothetical protein VM532_06300 [Burkholderiales bacterium]|nr:hypothetical protein [Burkholderiales bacterium]
MKKLIVALAIAVAAPVVSALDLPKLPPPPLGLPKPPTLVSPGDLKEPAEPKEAKASKKKRHHHKHGHGKGGKKGK